MRRFQLDTSFQFSRYQVTNHAQIDLVTRRVLTKYMCANHSRRKFLGEKSSKKSKEMVLLSGQQNYLQTYSTTQFQTECLENCPKIT